MIRRCEVIWKETRLLIQCEISKIGETVFVTKRWTKKGELLH
jgi:hypothetical protein